MPKSAHSKKTLFSAIFYTGLGWWPKANTFLYWPFGLKGTFTAPYIRKTHPKMPTLNNFAFLHYFVLAFIVGQRLPGFLLVCLTHTECLQHKMLENEHHLKGLGWKTLLFCMGLCLWQRVIQFYWPFGPKRSVQRTKFKEKKHPQDQI